MSLPPTPPPFLLVTSPDVTPDDLARLALALHESGLSPEEAVLVVGQLCPPRSKAAPSRRPLPAWPRQDRSWGDRALWWLLASVAAFLALAGLVGLLAALL